VSLKAALAHGGALVAVLAVVAGSIVGETAKPFDRAADVVAPGSPAVEAQICPDGWTDTSAQDGDAVVRSCLREIDGVKWRVILYEDGAFSHGFAVDQPGAEFIFEPEAIPQWPR